MPKAKTDLRQKLQRDAMRRRRQMVQDELWLSADAFCSRRGVSRAQLARLVARGSVIAIDVDGTVYYPALFTDPMVQQNRVSAVCRMLQPAAPSACFHCLTARRGSLGDISPLEEMRTDKGYKTVRRFATAWAAERSRTIVSIYTGKHRKDVELPLVCTGVVDADPRQPMWRRANEALQPSGNLRPDGPYPSSKTITVFISVSTAGGTQDVPEARLDVVLKAGVAHCSVTSSHPRANPEPVPIDSGDDVVVVVRKILETMR
jgi:hypothetical protein